MEKATAFELSQMKIAQQYYRNLLQKGQDWRTILITSTIIIGAILWVLFLNKILWLPLGAGLIAGLILFSVISDYPGTKKYQRQTLAFIDKRLEERTIKKSTYQVKRAIIAGVPYEGFMAAFELESGETLLYSEADAEFGFMNYFRRTLTVYEFPEARIIFGAPLACSGESIPTNQVSEIFYTSFFSELMQGERHAILNFPLEELLEKALKHMQA